MISVIAKIISWFKETLRHNYSKLICSYVKISIHICEFPELYKFKHRDRVYLSVTNSDGSHCQILLARKQNYDETGIKWIIQYIIKCSVYLSYVYSFIFPNRRKYNYSLPAKI